MKIRIIKNNKDKKIMSAINFKDLKIVLSVRTNRAAGVDDTVISFNTSSAAFTNRYLLGDGASTSSGTNSYYILTNGATSTASTFSNHEVYIPNYTGSNYKSFSVSSVSEDNNASAYNLLTAGLWSQTAAITSISLAPTYGTGFDTNSTFYLYGIKNS